MESIKKFTAALLLIAFTASASTNDFYTVNVYVGGKFKAQWFSPTVPPLNTVVQFNFPQKFAGPAIVDTQVWNSDTPNTLQLWTTEAIFKNGGYVRLTNPPPAVPLTNWFDTIAIGTTNSYQFMTNGYCGISQDVVSNSGTVVAVRLALGSVKTNGVGLKMAVYTLGGSLVTQGSTTVNKSDSFTTKVVYVAPRPVTKGTNLIAFSVILGPNLLYQGTNATFAAKTPGSASYYQIGYNIFPTPTLINGPTNFNLTYYLGEDVQ